MKHNINRYLQENNIVLFEDCEIVNEGIRDGIGKFYGALAIGLIIKATSIAIVKIINAIKNNPSAENKERLRNLQKQLAVAKEMSHIQAQMKLAKQQRNHERAEELKSKFMLLGGQLTKLRSLIQNTK